MTSVAVLIEYNTENEKSKTKLVYIQKIKIFPLAFYYNDSVCIEKESGYHLIENIVENQNNFKHIRKLDFEKLYMI